MDVAALKKDYRFIFCTQVAGRTIYWRPLTLKEHDIYTKVIQLGLSPIGEVEDRLFRKIVLSPDVVDSMNLSPAGLVSSISQTALSLGGNLLETEDDISRMNLDIQEMRAAVNDNPYDQFIILICKAFPRYTPFEVENLEYQEMLRLLVMAEQLVGLEEPVQLKKDTPKKNLTESLFKDRKMAEGIDRANQNKLDPSLDRKRMLQEAHSQKDLSVAQARQIEMVNRIRQRNAS